jgi:hypothetical protein
MDEVLDDRLERESARTGTSKAALIRACVAERYASPSSVTDPIDALIGAFDGAPVDDLDQAIYG